MTNVETLATESGLTAYLRGELEDAKPGASQDKLEPIPAKAPEEKVLGLEPKVFNLLLAVLLIMTIGFVVYVHMRVSSLEKAARDQASNNFNQTKEDGN